MNPEQNFVFDLRLTFEVPPPLNQIYSVRRLYSCPVKGHSSATGTLRSPSETNISMVTMLTILPSQNIFFFSQVPGVYFTAYTQTDNIDLLTSHDVHPGL